MYAGGRDTVFNDMMRPYRKWDNNGYHVQYETEELDKKLIADTILRANNKSTETRPKRRRKSTKIEVRTNRCNDEGYPLDDPEDTFMQPLKHYDKGFNCKTNKYQ